MGSELVDVASHEEALHGGVKHKGVDPVRDVEVHPEGVDHWSITEGLVRQMVKSSFWFITKLLGKWLIRSSMIMTRWSWSSEVF